MKDIPSFPYFPIEFDKDAKLFSADAVARLKTHLAQHGTTDLLVLSHGWNNDKTEADELYEELLTNAAAFVTQGKLPALAGRKFAVLGVLWPSKKFADKELIPSGAAGVASPVEVAELREKLTHLAGAFDAPDSAQKIERLKALLPKLEDSDAACREFADVVRSLVVPRQVDDEDASRGFMKMDGLDLFQTLSQPVSFASAGTASDGGAAGMDDAGGAAGLGDFISGALSGARNLLNYTTYFQMKERAGLVGAKGVNPILRELRQSHPQLRLHLIGHSFGGRLVTAAAAGAETGNELSANSMCLLQAAFSHYGLAKNWDGKGGNGFFRRVVDKSAISGPIVVTCTTNDRAVGVAYPIASLVGGQTAAGLGDKDSKYGGIGRNGAQKTPEATDAPMQKAGQPYSLQAGRIHNLNADRFISDHGDVRNPNVAYAVMSAVAAAG